MPSRIRARRSAPLARFVEDLALVLPILSGLDWKDASVIPMPLENWRTVDVKTLRVACYASHAEAEPTPETVETCQRAAKRCNRSGPWVMRPGERGKPVGLPRHCGVLG